MDSEKRPHVPFSAYLRQRLSETHERSTQNPFFKALFANTLTKEQYAMFLEGAFYVYATMERELELHKADPGVGPIHFPAELDRLAAVEEDLAFYTGCSRPRSPPTATVVRYMNRILGAAGKLFVDGEKKRLGAVLLMAHSYTRYFGDMSGGQFISEQLKTNWNLEGDQGRKFYRFNVPSIPEFKAKYVAAMDTIAAQILDSLAKEDRFVDEALAVFALNDDMLRECVGECASAAAEPASVAYAAFRAAAKPDVVAIEIGPVRVARHRCEAARMLAAVALASLLALVTVVLRTHVPGRFPF
ncbi:hypothetical protein DFJ74DRAFT_678134 [Hyaloraphidium curvatum]|nr:hypothetical protein DFJ74DRAFT_678134 [Hyaloraphidium curvatum]